MSEYLTLDRGAYQFFFVKEGENIGNLNYCQWKNKSEIDLLEKKIESKT
jgi:hypothetical protein